MDLLTSLRGWGRRGGRSTATPAGRSAGGGRDRLDSMRKGLSVFQLKANGKRRPAEYAR